MVDHTGTMGAGTTWADGDRITGVITVPNGADVTVTAGATITVTGNYYVQVTGTGKFVATGTAASRITIKSSATDPIKGEWYYIYLSQVTSTGNSVQYCNIRHTGLTLASLLIAIASGGGIEPIQYNEFSACVFGISTYTGNTVDLTIRYNTFKEINTGGIRILVDTNTGDITIQNNYFLDCLGSGAGGILIADGGVNTYTIQDNEFENCSVGIYSNVAGPTITIQRNLFRNCESAFQNAGTTNATVTFDKNFIAGNGLLSLAYGAIHAAATAITPALILSSNIIGTEKHNVSLPVYQVGATGQRITSSGNDIVGGVNITTGTGLYIIDADNGSTSDNDFIAGNNRAQMANVDISESTTSTETPKQYQNLTNARTNARSATNYPLTIDTIVFTATGDGATATWNSNRPMNSEVYLAEVTGVDVDDPTTYDICFIRDDDWSTVKNSFATTRGTYKDKVTGGMIGTAHSVTIAGLKAGTQYFYVVRGVDPAGNVATSTEGNFTTTGAAPAVSAITVSPTSIKTNEETTVTATITNTPTEAAVEINDVVFDMDNTTGDTWSATIKGHLVGVVSAETVTVFATNASGGAQANSASTLTVTKPTIAAATLVHDFTVWLRDLLLNNVTDPISASRSATSKWVMSSFPQRPAEYPLVVVEVTGVNHEKLGLRSEETFATIQFETRIFSKSTKQRDTIWDSIYNFLRTYQTGSGESISIDLVDFKLINTTNIDEDGKAGIHQKVGEMSYRIVISS